MRIFERLRTIFGLGPIQLQNDSKATYENTGTAAAAPSSPSPPGAEAMCCGHCSGNAEGHISELPSAR